LNFQKKNVSFLYELTAVGNVEENVMIYWKGKTVACYKIIGQQKVRCSEAKSEMKSSIFVGHTMPCKLV